MKILSAHVRGGRIVADEPTDLPEGTVVYVYVPDGVKFSPEERALLAKMFDESQASTSAASTTP